MEASADRVTVMVSTPLEEEHVRRIGSVDGRVELLWEPALLPPPRYAGDHAGDSGFRRDQAAEARWAALLQRAQVLFGIPGDTPSGLVETIRRAPRLRWLHGTQAGAGEQVWRAGLDPEELSRVTITTSAGVHAVPLAEFALFGLLAFTKELPRLLEGQERRSWPALRRPQQELRGKTVFIVGLGSIGVEVARLAKAFGIRTVGFRRNARAGAPHTDAVYPAASLRERAPDADAVVVTLPLTPQTKGLIDRDTIARLRPSCILVNVGRGAVVDEAALAEAAREGRIAGAALDVFASEPLPPDSPLWTLPNVLVSPHTAALSVHENERIVELFVANLRRFLAGEPLANVVDPTAFY